MSVPAGRQPGREEAARPVSGTELDGTRFDLHEVPPRSGVAFTVRRGETLTVIDPLGEQVADLLAFCLDDTDEVISSGRTLDYAGRI